VAKETFRTFKGVRDIVITDLDGTSPRVLVIPAASKATYSPGVTQAEVLSSSSTGETVVVDRYVTEKKPTLTLELGVKGIPEVLGLKLGQKFASGSRDVFVERSNLLVPASGVLTAATTGIEGFGVAADAVTIASYYDPVTGLSVPLTQGAFAGFDPTADPLKFAVGANGAMKFGNSLIGKYVSFRIPNTALAGVQYLSSTPFVNLSLSMVVLNSDNKVVKWTFPSVTPDITADLPINEPTISIPFFINFLGGCELFSVEFIGQLSIC